MLILITVSTHPRDEFYKVCKEHHLDLVSLRSNLRLNLELPISEAMKGAKNLCRCTGRGLVKKSATLMAPGMCRTMNWRWAPRSWSQWSRMSHDLESLGLTDFWARPTATSLSQWMTVGGCGYPKSSSTCRSPVPILAAAKVPAYSASCTDEHTIGMPVECTEMGALMKSGSWARVRWWNAGFADHEFGKFRYQYNDHEDFSRNSLPR